MDLVCPIGLTNRKKIDIKSFFGDESLTLNVKMVRGVYNPAFNAFNSDCSLLELCEMRIEKTDGEYSYSYEVFDDNAIIYKLKDGKRIAFAELCDISALGKGQKYLLTNGTFRIGETETIIVAPYHLAREQFWGSTVDTIKLSSEIDFNGVVEFYKFAVYYNVNETENGLALDLKDKKGTVIIRYNADEHSIKYKVASHRFR